VDRQFSHWFSVDCIFTNVSVVIHNVAVEECQTPSSDLLLSASKSSVQMNTDNDDDDDDEDEDNEELPAVMSTDSGFSLDFLLSVAN